MHPADCPQPGRGPSSLSSPSFWKKSAAEIIEGTSTIITSYRYRPYQRVRGEHSGELGPPTSPVISEAAVSSCIGQPRRSTCRTARRPPSSPAARRTTPPRSRARPRAHSHVRTASRPRILQSKTVRKSLEWFEEGKHDLMWHVSGTYSATHCNRRFRTITKDAHAHPCCFAYFSPAKPTFPNRLSTSAPARHPLGLGLRAVPHLRM